MAVEAQARPRRAREEEVLVWPDLVFIEFISALVFTAIFIAVSIIYDAPLLNKANLNLTPDPSKAPWYFLNLQELLLHMHPALAGVVVPTIALVGLAAIPYMDRKTEGQGVWFGTRYSGRIAIFSALYATIGTWALIVFNSGKHVQLVEKLGGSWPAKLNWLRSARSIQTETNWGAVSDAVGFNVEKVPVPFNNLNTGNLILGGKGGVFDTLVYPDQLNLNLPGILVEQIIPTAFMIGLPVLLVLILRKVGWIRDTRGVMIALFSGFMATYLTLTVVGSFFRGPGQDLVWPWDLRVDEG